MRPFAYARAVSVHDALAAGAAADTAVLAGGTELLNWMRLGIERRSGSSTSAGSTVSTGSRVAGRRASAHRRHCVG